MCASGPLRGSVINGTQRNSSHPSGSQAIGSLSRGEAIRLSSLMRSLSVIDATSGIMSSAVRRCGTTRILSGIGATEQAHRVGKQLVGAEGGHWIDCRRAAGREVAGGCCYGS
jgi:hypothetical protein